MSRCRSCGAEIVWAGTAAGERMPVDADPHPDGNVILTDRTPDIGHMSRWTAEVLGPIELAIDDGRARYRPHFATCDQADDWRRR